LKKRLNSFKYAFAGIIDLIRSEPNARIHLFFVFLVVGGGVFFNVSTQEWCWLVLAVSLVFSAEAFNTAIERLTDLASPDIHPLAGKAKDSAAGAVLISAIGAAVIGFIIFLPKVIDWLFSS
jgi:diacylglycerol kinase